MRYPTLEEIQEVFVRLSTSEVNGVQGVMGLDSGLAGPTVYIGVCTHGNERFGLAALTPLVLGWVSLKKGKLRIVINNLQAAINETRRFPADSSDDMNRLPSGLLEDASLAEGFQSRLRMRELHAAGLLDCDFGVDVHTLYTPSDSVLLPIKGDASLFTALPVSHAIHGIVDAQVDPQGRKTVAFGSFLGGSLAANIPVLELEGGGPHDSAEVIHRLVDALLALLISLDVVSGTLESIPLLRRTYRVLCNLWPHTSNLVLTEEWIHEQAAPLGTVFAFREDGEKLVVPDLPEAGGKPLYFLFPSPRCNKNGSLRPLNTFSEATFLGTYEEEELKVWRALL